MPKLAPPQPLPQSGTIKEIDLAEAGRVCYMTNDGEKASGVITRQPRDAKGSPQPPSHPDPGIVK